MSSPQKDPTHEPAGSVQGDEAPSRDLSPGQLERVRQRDPEALNLLFERYFDQVYGLAYRLLGDQAAAEDATQEVFLKVHRAAHTIDPQRNPGPWLTTITYNACRDLWRSASHKMGKASLSIDEDPDLGAHLTPDTRTPEQELLADERSRLVQEAIGRLPDTLREVLVLHEYQDMGHQEIAEVVGTSYAAVRKRYSRALAALGKLLKDSLG